MKDMEYDQFLKLFLSNQCKIIARDIYSFID